MSIHLSDFTPDDEAGVNRVALAAFEQYRELYHEWDRFAERVGAMASLAGSAEIIVARRSDEVVGAVAYVGPGRPRAEFFQPEWSIVRMLVVAPDFRGHGVGRALTNACIDRAVRDGAPIIALHTSRIMEVALAMYQRLGFRLAAEAPAIHGVPYGMYIKTLEPTV